MCEESAIENNIGPPIDPKAAENYHTMKDILQRLTRLCVMESITGHKPRKHEQRLLRNMGAHSAVLELLEIPYEKASEISSIYTVFRKKENPCVHCHDSGKQCQILINRILEQQCNV